jgi:CRP-like cAMP-binding protein
MTKIAPAERANEPALLLADDPMNGTANFDLLARLTPQERQRVRNAGTAQTHEHGETVFLQGAQHDGIYLVEAGRVRSYYTGPSGREITLAYWTPGHFVGGPEIFGGGIHIWSGVAVGPTRTRHLRGATVRRLMTEMPTLAVCLIEGLAYKGRCYSELLQVLATQSVEERLRQLLQSLSNLYGRAEGDLRIIDRHFSHEELATMVGSSRQWVTMTLNRLQKQGMITITGRKIALRPAFAVSSVLADQKPPCRTATDTRMPSAIN